MDGMARTPALKRKPAPKLRGRRQPIALTLPPDLVAEIDAVAAAEDRSRVKMIEIACRQYVQTYRRRPVAA
jgi:metal-responsive CopG/Arc/MetJ family transcriptional regulator